MRRKERIILILCLIFPIVLLVLARLNNWFVLYHVPTTNMHPLYKKGSYVLASSLLPIKKKSIVSYYADPMPWEETTDKYIAVCRVVACEGDTVEIKDGLFFLNNKMADDTTKLSYNFILVDYNGNLTSKDPDLKSRFYYFLNDSTRLFNGTFNEMNSLGLKNTVRRNIDTITEYFNASRFGSQHAYKKWSQDNMGSVIVPKDSYFIMGDNRGASCDSRSRGFIHKSKIIARTLN